MATKKAEKAITLEGIKEGTIHLHLVGDSPLILCKKSKSFETEEIYKQSHLKGEKLPDSINSKLHYNLFEKLITSITWEKPIPDHEAYEDYTKEEYEQLMIENRPCILSKAFFGSFTEAFISLGYKEATGRTGADFRRCVSIFNVKTPVDFAAYRPDTHLVPNSTINHTNVLTQYTEFSGWSCDLIMSYVESVFPQRTVIELVNSAGKFIGVGSRRGEGFGKWHVEEVTL